MESVVVIIPVLNEEDTIGEVVHQLRAHALTQICVVDNGSSDRTAAIATAAGATVISEPRRGYGQACWTGLQTPMAKRAKWILFCDGDGSDDLSELPALLKRRSDYDFILGNRRGTVLGRSQLTPVQNFGNRLATLLIRWGWGYAYEDLGPLRLMRRQSLDDLQMEDRGFGWTVEMQAKAVQHGLKIYEKPVNYLPRQGGKSKISGTVKGSFQAGKIILSTLAVLYWQKRWGGDSWLGKSRSAISQVIDDSRFQKGLLCAIASLIILGSALAIPYGDFLNQPDAVPMFWRGIAFMSIGFLATGLLQKINGGWFWLVAIVPRLLLLAMHPGDDIWRYLWEGHIQNLGFNPYLLAPDADALIPFRFDGWAQINHPALPAIYPPITQLGFRILSAITPSVLLFKSAFVVADLAICALLQRRFGYRATLLYAWNPLIIYSFAGGGHYDSWFLLPLVAAWLWFDTDTTPLQNRAAVSALLVGISIAVKWMSLPAVTYLAWQLYQQTNSQQTNSQQTNSQQTNNQKTNSHKTNSQKTKGWRTKWVLAILMLAILPMALAALPFCDGLSCPVVPLKSPFVIYGRSAALVPQFVSELWPSTIKQNWIYAPPLAMVVAWACVRSQQIGQFIERYLIGLLLLSPIIHAWYFAWLVPFAVASRNRGTVLVSISAFLYFVLPYNIVSGTGDWTLTRWQQMGLWGPFLLGLLLSTKKEVKAAK
ncbi:MAG: glycosyltransferase family 2 protein [Cyanobacteria bacterium J06627_28]